MIGEGSFSVVCLARDKRSGEGGQSLVAVKKIRDVFVHKVNAKNVIREVYIQRRLRHPNVVELLDLFMMPSPTGRWKMVRQDRTTIPFALLSLRRRSYLRTGKRCIDACFFFCVCVCVLLSPLSLSLFLLRWVVSL